MKLKKIVGIALGIYFIAFTGTVVASAFVSKDDTPAVVVDNQQAEEAKQATAGQVSDVPQSTTQEQTTGPVIKVEVPQTTTNTTPTTPTTTPSTPSTPSKPTTPSTPSKPTTPSTPPPPPPAPTCGNGGSCSAAQVATHNKQSDCWVIYSGKVYNITSYVPKHNGGAEAFTSQTCGQNIATYMTGDATVPGVKKHRHSNSAYTTLNSYFIATLQ